MFILIYLIKDYFHLIIRFSLTNQTYPCLIIIFRQQSLSIIQLVTLFQFRFSYLFILASISKYLLLYLIFIVQLSPKRVESFIIIVISNHFEVYLLKFNAISSVFLFLTLIFAFLFIYSSHLICFVIFNGIFDLYFLVLLRLSLNLTNLLNVSYILKSLWSNISLIFENL